MARILAVLFLAVLFASNALAQLASVGSSTPSAANVSAPQLNKGDRWIYSTIDRWRNEETALNVGVVTEADGKVVRIKWENRKSGGSAETLSTADLNVIESGIRDGKAGTRFTPHDHTFAFPLHVGKTWEGRATLDLVNEGRKVEHNVTARVVGWETVTVRGVSYEALKIEKTGSYTRLDNGGTGGLKWTYWYSPAVKRSVLVEFEDTKLNSRDRWSYTRTELVAYESAVK